MTFRDYVLENEKELFKYKIYALTYLIENVDRINESRLDEDLNKYLNKVGLNLKKNKGIIDYIMSFAKGIGKLFVYILKGDFDKAKELLKSIKKEDVMDFLLKLDLATLHILSGPIHMIDAWTGWELEANLEGLIQKGANIVDKIKTAIKDVKQGIEELFPPKNKKRNVLIKYVNKVENGVVKAAPVA